MRARFDAYKEESDPDKARLLYLDGCRQVWERKHWTTFRCKFFSFFTSSFAEICLNWLEKVNDNFFF